MKTLYENLGGAYHEENGHLIPNVTLPEQTDYQIGKYGQFFEKLHDCWSEYMSLAEAAISNMLLSLVQSLC